MKVIGVIPARYKSTRFPGKPLADIGGKPMIYHVYSAVKQSDLLDEVYVATEDDRIAEACDAWEIPWVMTRDTHPTGTDRVAEVAERMEADIFVNIQGDEPMIRPETINAAVQPLLDDIAGNIQVTNLCAAMSTPEEVLDTNTIKVVRGTESFGLYLSRQPVPYPRDRHDLRYYKQVCVYAFRRQALLAYGSWAQTPVERAEGIELLRFLEHGTPVKFIEVLGDNVAVDTPEDLRRVIELMASNAPSASSR